MLKKLALLTTCATLAFGLGACNMSADDAKSASVPETAMSRADVEAIVKAYLLENPEIIEEAQAVLREREYAQISEFLASSEGDFSIGPKDAPITIVEFFDYKCGYCQRAADWVTDKATNSDGKIRVVFKEFPILSDQSLEAAKAALASIDQDKYLEFHNELMAYSGALTRESIMKIAGDVGLNTAKLEKAMDSDDVMTRLQMVRMEAQAYGADATPSFFVNGELIQGFDKPALEARIAELLEG